MYQTCEKIHVCVYDRIEYTVYFYIQRIMCVHLYIWDINGIVYDPPTKHCGKIQAEIRSR